MNLKERVCVWIYDRDCGYYDTHCEYTIQFSHDEPFERGNFKYCPYCGAKIVVKGKPESKEMEKGDGEMNWEDELKKNKTILASFIDKQEQGEYKIFTRKDVIAIKDAIPFIKQLLQQQRENCLKNADMGFEETTGGYLTFISRLSILNAPEPSGGQK